MNTITEDYVSFETAKLLKEKRFDEKCLMAYIDGELFNYYDSDFPSEYELENDGSEVIDAPTQQMAMKWLREVYKLHIGINRGPKGYHISIETIPLGVIKYITNEIVGTTYINSYEQAAEVAIKYCLKTLI